MIVVPVGKEGYEDYPCVFCPLLIVMPQGCGPAAFVPSVIYHHK